MKITIHEDGTLWRRDRQIGTLLGNNVTLQVKISATLKAALQAATGRTDLVFAEAPSPTLPEAFANALPHDSSEPLQDPALGCKDPVWLAWQRQSA